MTSNKPNDLQLSAVTLSALINVLKLHGHDLERISREYSQEILGNKISGANPDLKSKSISHLSSLVADANNNPLL